MLLKGSRASLTVVGMVVIHIADFQYQTEWESSPPSGSQLDFFNSTAFQGKLGTTHLTYWNIQSLLTVSTRSQQEDFEILFETLSFKFLFTFK